MSNTYGPWKIWNATKDSVCPVAEGVEGQVQLAWHTRQDAIDGNVRELYYLSWVSGSGSMIVAYRILKEPIMEVKEYRALGYLGGFSDRPYIRHGVTPNGTVTATTHDGDLVELTWRADE